MVLFPRQEKQKLSPFSANVPIKFHALLVLGAGATRNRETIKSVRTLVSNRLNYPWIEVYNQGNP